MLVSLLYFLPCLVSFLWFVSFSFKVKTPRQVLFMWIQAASVFYFATYALYIVPATDFKTMVMMDAVNVPIILTILPLIVIYLRCHIKATGIRPAFYFLFVPAVAISSNVLLMYYIIGFDNAARMSESFDSGSVAAEFQTHLYQLYWFLSEDLVNSLSFIFLLIIITECVTISLKGGYRFGDIYRFFFKGNLSTPSRAIALMVLGETLMFVPMALLGRPFMIRHPLFGIIITMLMAAFRHCACHVEFYSDNKKEITLYFLSHLRLSEPVSEPQSDGVDEEDLDEEESLDETSSRMRTSGKIDLVAEKFQRLMEEEKIYKDENLTLLTLSERMGIGRTTLSAMVNNIYGISFRELLNNYRIQAVKDFMVANPTATQETIAFECGFKNASYLNSKFKEVVGDTPLMWLAKHGESSAEK